MFNNKNTRNNYSHNKYIYRICVRVKIKTIIKFHQNYISLGFPCLKLG